MGWAKKIMMEIQEQGDWPSDDLHEKYVCSHHFKDYGLKAMIDEKGHDGVCSYCGRKGTVRDMYSLCEDITWKVKMYFSDIDNAGLMLASSFYDDEHEIIAGYRRIGPYIAPIGNTYFASKDTMLQNLGLVSDNEQLDKDISDVFTTEQWISRDFYEEDQTVKLNIQWNKFAASVKYNRRFTFLALPEFEPMLVGDGGHSENILSGLQELMLQQGLISTLPPYSKIYRARKVSDLNKQYGFIDITSSPNKVASSNRMSPAGVSMFYASFEKETAMKECVGNEEDAMIVGTFETARELTIVDFTKIPKNSFWVSNWQGIRFLNMFHSNITKKVDPEDKNLLQYVPTQVLTEYIRYMLKDESGKSIDGMIYGSAKTNDKNIVLFCSQQNSYKFVRKDVLIEKFAPKDKSVSMN